MIKKLTLLFLITCISLPASAQLLQFERDDKLIQKELNLLATALRSDQKSRLPEKLIVTKGVVKDLPKRPGCESVVDELYITKDLSINDQLLQIMGTSKYNEQYKGCSHKIAFFLALERALNNFELKDKRNIRKRTFTKSQLALLDSIIESIILSTHEKLQKDDIKLSIFAIDSDEYFMISNFKFSRVLGKHHYRIGVNPKIFALDIPSDALRAVLAHELQHTEDYISKSFITGIIPIGIKLLFKKYRYRYERQTDLKTVLKGYGTGLISYKRWQYHLLSDEDLKVKRENYLSPGEIDLILSRLKKQENRIRQALSGRMPKNLEEWFVYLN